MEEKERYIIDRFDEDIFDTKKEYYPSNQTICEIINKQDKEIKKLEEYNNKYPYHYSEEYMKNNRKLEAESKQLKQQLAESEKNFIIANNLRKNSDEVLLNYKTKKYGLDKTIEELRKMKLSLPQKEWYYKGFENCERQMSSHIADLTLQVKELKQKLADKEQENEHLKKEICKYEITLMDKNSQLKKQHQDKISFCIEQLEKVKSAFGLINSKLDKVETIKEYIHYIDHQINELKELK